MQNLNFKVFNFLILITIFFTSCQSKYSLDNRVKNLNELVKNSPFDEVFIKTSLFNLKSFQKIEDKNLPIKFYIEGDGFSYIDKYTISSNPTPLEPTALKVALNDSYPNIVYLARPCQYINSQNCSEFFWGEGKYSFEIINSISEAITILKGNSKSKQIKVVGYSGGGTIALLLGTYREDVEEIVTIAGNLNPKLLHELYEIPVMKKSLNPMDFINRLKNIKQTHYIVKNDEVVPKEVSNSYFNAVIDSNLIKIIELENSTHNTVFKTLFLN